MIRKLERIFDELYSVDGVESCILYRIDGFPVILRAPRFSEKLLSIMMWLEKQIHSVLKEIDKEGLSRTIFYFKDRKILIAPCSKSTVLVTVIAPGVHQLLTSIEIERITSEINKCVT
jgi:predicted regulator of Ras-like GTPase activity (Roadblock/LC7/MglB family)